jgi:hypothetical protein
MALKADLRSSDDKKFKGHTEDNTIKVASVKKFINAGIQGAFRTFNPSFILTNKLRDTLSKKILKKLKKK